jgi:hypothetical protein
MFGPVRYAYGGQFLPIELAVDGRAVQILEFVDDSRAPLYHFRHFEYLVAESLLGGLGEPHLLLTDAHLLPYPKRREAFAVRTFFLCILFQTARTSASVTREGAMPVVEWTVSL